MDDTGVLGLLEELSILLEDAKPVGFGRNNNLRQVDISHGTTTVITDPHEVGNVMGVRGVRYMHDCGADLPMRQLIDIPSCVPAVPGMENSGADFMADEITQLAGLERVAGLAEVMDFLAVMHGDERMLGILQAAREHGLYAQGHAPMVSGRGLSACVNECTVVE